MTPTVLFEDNHCLVVDKPAGMLAQGDRTGDPSLVDWVAEYWKLKYGKPGNVFVGLVHRLDRPTSGLVLLARTSKAAGRLADQFRLGSIRKVYQAVCEGGISYDEGIWEDYLIKDPVTNTVRIGAGQDRARAGQYARLEFAVEGRSNRFVRFILRPTTGRGHQLRVQLASRGLPIVGDSKYGAKSRLMAGDGLPRIALHAIQLTFMHPTKGEPCEFRAPLPPEWPVEEFDSEIVRTGSNKPGEPQDR